MIAVAMRHDHEIKLRQVNVARLYVAGEDGGVVPGVKQDSFSRVLNERRLTPVLLHLACLAERIVKHSDSRSVFRGWLSLSKHERGKPAAISARASQRMREARLAIATPFDLISLA
jgi:hypothetical protein